MIVWLPVKFVFLELTNQLPRPEGYFEPHQSYLTHAVYYSFWIGLQKGQ